MLKPRARVSVRVERCPIESSLGPSWLQEVGAYPPEPGAGMGYALCCLRPIVERFREALDALDAGQPCAFVIRRMRPSEREVRVGQHTRDGLAVGISDDAISSPMDRLHRALGLTGPTKIAWGLQVIRPRSKRPRTARPGAKRRQARKRALRRARG